MSQNDVVLALFFNKFPNLKKKSVKKKKKNPKPENSVVAKSEARRRSSTHKCLPQPLFESYNAISANAKKNGLLQSSEFRVFGVLKVSLCEIGP